MTRTLQVEGLSSAQLIVVSASVFTLSRQGACERVLLSLARVFAKSQSSLSIRFFSNSSRGCVELFRATLGDTVSPCGAPSRPKHCQGCQASGVPGCCILLPRKLTWLRCPTNVCVCDTVEILWKLAAESMLHASDLTPSMNPKIPNGGKNLMLQHRYPSMADAT